MLTTAVTFGDLIDRALIELQGPSEVGRRTVLNTALSPTDTTFLLSGDPVNGSDIIEFGDELLLVTGKTDDVDPTYTVARGYFGTTATAHALGTSGIVNPSWPRFRVGEAVRRAFSRMAALGLPLVTSATFNRTADKQYVEMPAITQDVYRVGYFSPESGRFWELPDWRFFEDLPNSVITSGKIIRLAKYIANTDDLEVTYRIPYRWPEHPARPAAASTILVPEGAEDVPSAYAVAWMLSAREISRADIDKAEEWNRGEPQRGGVSLSLIRAKWQEFYRILDEARRLNVVPVTRPYVRMPRF